MEVCQALKVEQQIVAFPLPIEVSMFVRRSPNILGGEDIFVADGDVRFFVTVQPRRSFGVAYFTVTVYDGDREEVYRFAAEEAMEEFISSLIS